VFVQVVRESCARWAEMSSDDLFGDVPDADFLTLAGQLDTASAPKAPPTSVPATRPPPRPSPAANPLKTTPLRPLRPAFNSIIVNSRQVINNAPSLKLTFVERFFFTTSKVNIQAILSSNISKMSRGRYSSISIAKTNSVVRRNCCRSVHNMTSI
jgi:hypothetical protein